MGSRMKTTKDTPETYAAAQNKPFLEEWRIECNLSKCGCGQDRDKAPKQNEEGGGGGGRVRGRRKVSET
jgi:hypothetical protein